MAVDLFEALQPRVQVNTIRDKGDRGKLPSPELGGWVLKLQLRRTE